MRSILFSLFLIPSLFAQDVPPPFEDKPPEGTEAAEDPFDPDTDAPKLIQVQVEWIEVSHETLTDLLFMRKKGTADATDLRKELQAMVKAGKAKILETQIGTGRSGEKFTVESIHEFIYPTEAEPAELPNSVSIPDKKDSVTPDTVKALAGLVAPHTPTSFETRNLGSTAEFEPTLGSDNKIIDLRFAPELVWHSGNTSWQERKDVLGNIVKVEEPDMYSARTTTALTMKDGDYTFVAALSPKNQAGDTDMERKLMIFVKCDVLSVR